MKDHPDEFLMRRKWDELINEFGEYFTEEELSAYKAARGEMMRDLFNESVLKRLAGEEDSDIEKARTTTGKMVSTFGTTDPRAMYGHTTINTPSLAAKQANAAMQQEAYNAALQQRLYSEQRGMMNSAGSLGNFISPF
jgi:hypothetical protein